jgi:hypothetical protein
MNFKRDSLKKLMTFLLCVAMGVSVSVPSALAASDGYKVTYDGGSVSDVKAGADMHLVIGANEIHLVKDKSEVVAIPASAVTEISYGQDVHRRVGAAIGLAVFSFGIGGLMALTKSKKHFVGITGQTARQRAALQCNATKATIAAFWPDWKA